MTVMGFSEPVLFGIIIVVIIFIIKVLPLLIQTKQTTDYNNFDMKYNNAHWSFAGISGPGYTNIKLSSVQKPTYHGDGTYTIFLSGFPMPLRNVKMNPLSRDCNVKLRQTAETLLGIRVDVLCNIDANGVPHEWDSAYVNNWEVYRDRLTEGAKNQLVNNLLRDKEIQDELKGAQQLNPLGGNANMDKLFE